MPSAFINLRLFRVSSQYNSLTSSSTAFALSVMSPRFPSGVGTRYSFGFSSVCSDPFSSMFSMYFPLLLGIFRFQHDEQYAYIGRGDPGYPACLTDVLRSERRKLLPCFKP